MNRQPKTPATLVLLLGLLCPGGCVALNVPSERIADPSDRGGLFGHWRGTKHHPSVGSSTSPLHRDFAMPSEGTCVEGDCWDGGPLDADSCAAGAEAKPAPPEVPWPRFLPVPTRPVFGSPTTEALFGP